MLKSIIIRLLLFCYYLYPINGQSFQEKYRLQVHYSVPSGWANDPNGLIFVGGYYHLFYQHNPFDTKFGPIHWGHARSTDLIRWETMPIALTPYDKGDIFSGCCVIDEDDVTGIGPKTSRRSEGPLIALYTLHKGESQTQALAYSFDNGTTWTQYSTNPVIPNPGIPDFRDPNVFKRDGKYYMTLAVKDRISFYGSTDLKSWNYLSDFGVLPNEGDKSGVWECPSVITLHDKQGYTHDVLIVSENGDARGSMTQYFVGKFDGIRFRSYNPKRILWIDNGYDNYAAIPYHNDPYGRVIIIGWLSNWLYAQEIPTTIWRGQWTIPRELSLRNIDGYLHIVQRPVEELKRIIDISRDWSISKPLDITGDQIIDLSCRIPFRTGIILKYVFDLRNVKSGRICLRFGNSLRENVSFCFSISESTYEFDRSNSGNTTFNSRFLDPLQRIDRISTSNLVKGEIILDTASIEIFADDGLNTISSLFFPSKPYENIQILGWINEEGKSVTVQRLSVSVLNSIWPK